LRFAIGIVLILIEGFYYWRLLFVADGPSHDESLLTKLPFEVCEWSAFLTAFMIMKKSRNMFDIAYYVCLTLGVLPFFMPAVIDQAGPAYARYYQFWLEHLIPVYAVFYMMFVHGFKADYKKVWKPFAWLGVMACCALILNNTIEGASFMYLSKGTSGASIVNMMPENMYVRLLVYCAILVVLFTLVSLPQIIPQIKAAVAKKKAAAAANAESVATEETDAESAETVAADEVAATEKETETEPVLEEKTE
ncbi:MAG: YwaF family protein, partial [Clostridia bacterium]|nr:YwaF family protein [Clostridia bacterium]